MPGKGRLGLLLLLIAAPVAAQSTGTPVFHAPYRAFQRTEIGASISDQGNISLEGFYGMSQSGGKWDLSLRGGVQDDGPGGRTALLAGVDGRFRVIDQTEDFPLDGAIILGVGTRLVRDASRLLIPIGLSVGRRLRFENSSITLVPYAEPLIAPTFGSGDSDVLVALGLGGDLRLSRRFEVRVGVGIGDIENFSVSFAYTR
jgi:hypothetical protein